jgi:hypothetical protein
MGGRLSHKRRREGGDIGFRLAFAAAPRQAAIVLHLSIRFGYPSAATTEGRGTGLERWAALNPQHVYLAPETSAPMHGPFDRR